MLFRKHFFQREGTGWRIPWNQSVRKDLTAPGLQMKKQTHWGWWDLTRASWVLAEGYIY